MDYQYPLGQLKSKEIEPENVIFVAATVLRGEKSTFDRKEELKEAGFIFNSKIKAWGGWITNLEDGKEIINKLRSLNFQVNFESEMYSSDLKDDLEEYEEEL